MPAPAIPIARNEPPRLRSVTTRSGSSGWATRRWSATNATSSTTLAPRKASVTGSVQPSDSARRHAEHEREQAGRGDERAGDVEPRPRRRRHVVEQAQAADRGRDREQDRHVQAPAPVEHLGQEAAEQQAEGAAGAGDRAVDAERLGALAGLGERGGEQRERGRGEQRGEHALEGAGADEQPEALRGAAERGCTGEADQAGDERPLAAEQVGDPAAEQQQAAERERVGGDDPLASSSENPRSCWAEGSAMLTIVTSSTTSSWAMPMTRGSASGGRDGVCGVRHGEDLTDVESRSPVTRSTSGDIISTL